jgi:hypothetical protein
MPTYITNATEAVDYLNDKGFQTLARFQARIGGILASGIPHPVKLSGEILVSQDMNCDEAGLALEPSGQKLELRLGGVVKALKLLEVDSKDYMFVPIGSPHAAGKPQEDLYRVVVSGASAQKLVAAGVKVARETTLTTDERDFQAGVDKAWTDGFKGGGGRGGGGFPGEGR